MQAAIFSSWTLFFGIFLFMAGNGLQTTLLGTRAGDIGFGDALTGIVMSGYYAGFLGGSLLVPKLVERVGHIRVFGALSAVASSSVLVHAVFDQASIWMVMRCATGFAYSGLYIVAESWINDKATNKTRGVLLSVYMMVIMTGLMIGQLMIGISAHAVLVPFVVVSVLVSLSVIPILLTAAKSPDFNEPERISLARVFNISPLAVLGMFFNGLNTATIFSMGPVYASRIGMPIEFIGIFISSIVFGAMVLQYPIGWLSDRFDRRTVILGVQIGVVVAAAVAFFSEAYGFYWMVLAAFFYGGMQMPTYSLFIAHANDYLTPRQIVAASSMLILINGIGAVGGPPITGYIMEVFGPSSFFPLLCIGNAFMVGIVIFRMLKSPAMPPEAQGAFVAMGGSARGTAMAATLNPEAEWTEDDNANNPKPQRRPSRAQKSNAKRKIKVVG